MLARIFRNAVIKNDLMGLLPGARDILDVSPELGGYPQGGVAPTSHDLARYNHIRKVRARKLGVR